MKPISGHLLNIQCIRLEPCGSATLMSNLILSPLHVHLKSPATQIFVQAHNKEIKSTLLDGRQIPFTKGQWCGKHFHVITTSWLLWWYKLALGERTIQLGHPTRGYPAKRAHLPCVSMPGRALLAGYHPTIICFERPATSLLTIYYWSTFHRTKIASLSSWTYNHQGDGKPIDLYVNNTMFYGP